MAISRTMETSIYHETSIYYETSIYHGDFNLICVYSFIYRLAHSICHPYHGIFKSKMDPEYIYIGTSQKNWDFYQCVDD